jgi:hypothetical protein
MGEVDSWWSRVAREVIGGPLPPSPAAVKPWWERVAERAFEENMVRLTIHYSLAGVEIHQSLRVSQIRQSQSDPEPPRISRVSHRVTPTNMDQFYNLCHTS